MANIDRLAQGTCPTCGQFRGSLWKDRRTGEIVASCIVCRRESRGPSPLAASSGDNGANLTAAVLALDSPQAAGAACVIDVSRAPTLVKLLTDPPAA